MERLVGAVQELSEKVESNEGAAGELLRQCESLQEELKAMRQYRECMRVLGSDEDSRVHLPNIEFSYIKQLQQDNSELRTLLEEHQATLEMVMSKYREQVTRFMTTEKDEGSLSKNNLTEELQFRTDQVYNMAAVMYKAALAEDSSAYQMMERVSKLEYENLHLRELLQFSTPMLEANERMHTPASGSHPPDSHRPQPPPYPSLLQSGANIGVNVTSTKRSKSLNRVDSLTLVDSLSLAPPNQLESHTVDSETLNSISRNEIHRHTHPPPSYSASTKPSIGEGGQTLVNCVDQSDLSGDSTPLVESSDTLPVLEMARERLADSVR